MTDVKTGRDEMAELEERIAAGDASVTPSQLVKARAAAELAEMQERAGIEREQREAEERRLTRITALADSIRTGELDEEVRALLALTDEAATALAAVAEAKHRLDAKIAVHIDELFRLMNVRRATRAPTEESGVVATTRGSTERHITVDGRTWVKERIDVGFLLVDIAAEALARTGITPRHSSGSVGSIRRLARDGGRAGMAQPLERLRRMTSLRHDDSEGPCR
jgi:hypothetical protein